MAGELQAALTRSVRMRADEIDAAAAVAADFPVEEIVKASQEDDRPGDGLVMRIQIIGAAISAARYGSLADTVVRGLKLEGEGLKKESPTVVRAITDDDVAEDRARTPKTRDP